MPAPAGMERYGGLDHGQDRHRADKESDRTDAGLQLGE